MEILNFCYKKARRFQLQAVCWNVAQDIFIHAKTGSISFCKTKVCCTKPPAHKYFSRKRRKIKKKLVALAQRSCTSLYVNEIGIFVIAVSNIIDDYKVDELCAALKSMIPLEVPKTGPMSLKYTIELLLNTGKALHDAGRFDDLTLYNQTPGPQLMNNDILE